MTSGIADSIRRGLHEALAYAQATAGASGYRIHVPRDIDVKAKRAKLEMTREKFVGRFGFSIHTPWHWEQGRLLPEGATRPISVLSTATEDGSEGGRRGVTDRRARRNGWRAFGEKYTVIVIPASCPTSSFGLSETRL